MRASSRITLLIFLLAWSACTGTTKGNAETHPDRIAFLGDSITAGGATHGGYCRLVIQGLKSVGSTATPILAGVPGNTSADMLLRLDETVLDHDPDLVFVAAGVNDIWHHDPTVKIGVFQAKPGMGVGVELYKTYMRQIVQRCEKAGAKVILSTITPIKEDPEFKLNKTAREYNSFLRELAAEKNLPLAELHEATFSEIARLKALPAESARRNVLTSDGVHPIPAGHQIMAKGILKALGLTPDQIAQAEAEWSRSPVMLILGDRQSNAGGRTGGWCHMLMDGMNSGRGMVTYQTVSRTTIADLLQELDRAVIPGRTRYLLLQSPKGDIDAKTSLAEYESSVRSLVLRAREAKLTLVVATIPAWNNHPEDDINQQIDKYNQVLRRICRDEKLPLADIFSAMRDQLEAEPTKRLTIGDERLNHEGGGLFAELVLQSLGYDGKAVRQMRETWNARPSYTYAGDFRATTTIPLSLQGVEALKSLRARYHQISDGRILGLGLYHLLSGDPERNRKRIERFDKGWAAPGQPEAQPCEISHRMMPSTDRVRQLENYMRHRDLSLAGLYSHAFKVGVHILQWEDPLGRGDN